MLCFLQKISGTSLKDRFSDLIKCYLLCLQIIYKWLWFLWKWVYFLNLIDLSETSVEDPSSLIIIFFITKQEVSNPVKHVWSLLEGIQFFFSVSPRQLIENPQPKKRKTSMIHFQVRPNLSRYNENIIISVLLLSAPFFSLTLVHFLPFAVNLMGYHIPFLLSGAKFYGFLLF